MHSPTSIGPSSSYREQSLNVYKAAMLKHVAIAAVFLATILCGEVCSQWQEPQIVELPKNLKYEDIDKYLETVSDQLGQMTDCRRPCKKGQNRICFIELNVENYQAMGVACANCSRGNAVDCYREHCIPADGFEKGVVSINRKIPGPLIELCQDDLLVAHVINRQHSDTFSIHWHGQLQKETPYMDGVPYITQCPILPLNEFRYTFWARDVGTFLYHSHSGMQRYNGAYGGLIVRKPKEIDVNSKYYDYDDSDHAIVLSDYSHEAVEMFYVGLPTRPPGLLPQSALLNGRGRFYLNATTFQAPTPYYHAYVRPGKRHRFRIINAVSTVCPARIQFEGHRMTIIATDAYDVQPEKVDSIIIHTGERYDVVIEANQPSGLYWIHLRLMGACNALNVAQVGVLSYVPGSDTGGLLPSSDPNNKVGFPVGTMIGNSEINNCNTDPNNKCITELQTLVPTNIMNRKPDKKFYMRFLVKQLTTANVFKKGNYSPYFNIRGLNAFLATVNDISYRPPMANLLSQPEDVDQSQFCTEENLPERCEGEEVCICVHTVEVNKGDLVEFVLFDASAGPGTVPHPVHYHGLVFYVTAVARRPGGGPLTVQRVKEMEARGELKANTTRPVIKDMAVVPNQGVIVIRFIADNPGFWLTHCHIEDHMNYGMAFLVLIRGKYEPVPKDFPKCGPFPPRRRR